MNNDALKLRIAAIKARINLSDEMDRRGIVLSPCGGSTARLEGCCPFHDDSTPSLSVYQDSQQFHCFGCGAHGDVVDFVQRMEGISFLEALRELEQGQGRSVALPANAATRDRLTRQHRDRSRSGSLVVPAENHAPILSVALAIYRQVLFHHTPALSYLARRGIAPETSAQLGLGYCDGYALRRALSGHAESWRAAQRAGLLTSRGKEWFSGRIVVPEIQAHTCTWMIGRLIPHLSSQTFVIRREQRYIGLRLPKPLLGYTAALEHIQRQGHHLHGILVVEGALDYVLARQWGLPAVPVALLATLPSRRQREQLLHLQTLSGLPVIDWHDADARGRIGALHLLDLLRGYPCRIMPEIAGVKDLADLAVHPFGLAQLAHAWQGMSDGDPL